MRCPFFWLSAPFLAGILCFEWIPVRLPVFLMFFLLPALGFSIRSRGFLPALCLAWFFLGVLYSYADHFQPPDAVERFSAGSEFVRVKGEVNSLPEIKIKGKKRTVSFVLDSREVSRHSARGKVQVYLINPKISPGPGDFLSLYGKLEPPKSFSRDFDYPEYLRSQGITAVFQGIGWRSVFILKKGHSSWIFRIREKIAETIGRYAGGRDGAVFKALVLGTRAGLDSETKDIFFRSGTSHLLAISGLNIALVAGTFYLILIACGIERRMASFFGILFSFFQVGVAGMGYPVLRAGWMAGAGFLAIVLNRPRHSLNLFFLALLCVLLPDTRAAGNVSFQLSFLSVLSMIVFFPLWEEWKWKDFWAVPLAVTLGTFPVVLGHFGGISTVGWPANFFAVPLFHFTLLSVLMGLVLAWVPPAAFLFFSTASFFLKATLAWIYFCASHPWSYARIGPLSAFQTAGYYLVLAVLILLGRSRSENARGRKKRFLPDEPERLQNKDSLRA